MLEYVYDTQLLIEGHDLEKDAILATGAIVYEYLGGASLHTKTFWWTTGCASSARSISTCAASIWTRS